MNSLHFIDVTMRDGHQCLWSTRMTTDMMAPILSTVDRVGFAYVNILGGAVFDVCVRYLKENPWERIRLVSSRLTKTPVDALTRGQSLYTFELFPDDIVELNVKRLAVNGIANLTVYDALNDNRNLEASIRAAHREGITVTALMVYTISPVHTDEYYRERARELVRLGADRIGIKDPTGLLLPDRARTLFPTVVQEAGEMPVELHSHCQSGFAQEVYMEAIESGITYLHTAVTPLANGASLPPTESIEEQARLKGFHTGLQPQKLREMSGYFRWLCYRENKPVGKPPEYDPALFEHQVPGGMISNLQSQLRDMQMEHKLNEILQEAAQVRRDLGYPILVSPFAQYVITQAVLNVAQGERYKTVPDEVRKYALGHYGKLAAAPSELFLERAGIGDQSLRMERAGEYLQPGIPRLRSGLGPIDDEQLLLAAFYDEGLRKSIRSGSDFPYHTSPLIEFIRYLDKKTDTKRINVSFAGCKLEMAHSR
ncbi:pyruvate carboxylase subunit B [Ferviditalea candida]|uniref:Pyruvate carboxylase subunit B n=1 Tax=Ferviditalea candida TaxID=3108399 RepID=A0ABU5ZI79_9BACL|nr:pyruvate carboxylase subunit B [Paenibacillaceae bacterium T2]